MQLVSNVLLADTWCGIVRHDFLQRGCVVHLLQNLIFRFLQSRQKVQIWLYEQSDLRIEGRIIVSP
jgi:hypothetical protein